MFLEAQLGSWLRAMVARCTFVSYRLILTVIALCATHAVTAADSSTNQINPLALLKSRNYAELERHYAARQQAYEAGSITEEILYGDFRGLYEDSAVNEQYFIGWVNAFPKSYSARMSRGTYQYRMAWFVRGAQYIGRTPRKQIAEMGEYLGKARDDLAASLEMTGKPYLSTLYLLNVSMMAGSGEERRHWLDTGNAIDPGNVLLRSRYMATLQPRWGGSHEEMRAFLAECRQKKLPPRTLARLDLIIRRDVADALTDGATPEKRYEVWGGVRRAEQEAGEQPSVEAVMRHTRAAWDLNNQQEAIEGLEQLARMNVEQGWALSQMAWIYGRLGRQNEGWSVVLKAAERNHPWAQYAVGRTIYEGFANLGVTADKDAGLAWIQRAADQKHAEAQAFLKSVK